MITKMKNKKVKLNHMTFYKITQVWHLIIVFKIYIETLSTREFVHTFSIIICTDSEKCILQGNYRDYKDETNTEIKTENKSEVNLDIIQNDKNSHNNYNFEKENKLILYSEQKLKGTLNFNIMCVIKFLYHKSSITIMFICMFINSNEWNWKE